MEKTTKKLLGVRIKELRKTRGLSQEQLSGKIDIDPKHLSRLEVGRSLPSLDTLEKLANALQVDLRDFFEFAHEAKNTKELKEIINNLLKEVDDERLRLAVKVLRALVR